MSYRFRVIGKDKDRVEFVVGDNDLHLLITKVGDTNKHQTVMVTGRGLHKIMERIALHLGYRTEKIR